MWGGLTLAAGVLEMVDGAALCGAGANRLDEGRLRAVKRAWFGHGGNWSA